MAQRNYIPNKNRQVRTNGNGNRRNTTIKQSNSRSPIILIALVVLVLIVFIGGLYMIMNNAPDELVEQQRTPASNELPPLPPERWQYTTTLESNSEPVINNDGSVQNLEQEALNALLAQQQGVGGTTQINQPAVDPNQLTTLPSQPQQPNTPNNGSIANANSSLPIDNTPSLQPVYTDPTLTNGQNERLNIGQAPTTINNLPNSKGTEINNNPLPTNALPSKATATPNTANNQTTVAIDRQKELEAEFKAEQQALLRKQEQERLKVKEQERLKAQEQEKLRVQEQERLKKQEQDRLKAEEIVRQNKIEAERLAAIEQERERKRKEQAAVVNKNPQTISPNSSKPVIGWQLQCGSFSDAKRAQEVKALLAFKGVQSQVVPAGNYNRVMIGPFNNRSQANDMQARAKSAGAPSCIILSP